MRKRHTCEIDKVGTFYHKKENESKKYVNDYNTFFFDFVSHEVVFLSSLSKERKKKIENN